MLSKSEYKIPAGKLVKINLEYDKLSKKIINIKITGDFFAYPEDSIEIIEKELKGVSLKKKDIRKKIDDLINSNNFEFIGLNSEGLSDGILRCLK